VLYLLTTISGDDAERAKPAHPMNENTLLRRASQISLSLLVDESLRRNVLMIGNSKSTARWTALSKEMRYAALRY